MNEIICIIGALLCPIFTLGCVLIHYNHTLLGLLIICISIISFFKK
jgi:hypothetical protein